MFFNNTLQGKTAPKTRSDERFYAEPRIYADLLGFQSRVKDPIHIIMLMKSIIAFFNHFFHALTLVYKLEKSKNNM